MSFGVKIEKIIASAASYVDRILRGANPAELPVQASTEFELVVNLKAAGQFGLQLRPALLGGADAGNRISLATSGFGAWRAANVRAFDAAFRE